MSNSDSRMTCINVALPLWPEQVFKELMERLMDREYIDKPDVEVNAVHDKDLEVFFQFNKNPPPVHNSKPRAWDLVIKDMDARNVFGMNKYGTPLQPFNGRDALTDAYEEALDLCVYLRTAIYERDNPKNVYE